MNEIRFYRANGPHGYLSNLYLCGLDFEGRTFDSAEHAYQFGKPRKIEVAEWLMRAPSASLCAQAAHALFAWQIREDWATYKIERMSAVLRAKFAPRSILADTLLLTSDAVLIEESTMDAFWGIGKKGTGANMLGTLLMEIRSELRCALDIHVPRAAVGYLGNINGPGCDPDTI